MARRTVLNVVEKIVSPAPDSRLMVGITHRPFLKSIPAALMELGIEHALVYGAIEGSDEAPLDGHSSLVRVRGNETEEFRVPPESLGLSRATKAHVSWRSAEDEARQIFAALEGGRGAVRDLILYNAALRLWVAEESESLVEGVEKAEETLGGGFALALLDALRQPAPVV